MERNYQTKLVPDKKIKGLYTVIFITSEGNEIPYYEIAKLELMNLLKNTKSLEGLFREKDLS